VGYKQNWFSALADIAPFLW